MTYSLGVDLGTTFVAAAVARPVGVAMVPLGDQSVVAPAVVAVRPDGSIVTGDAAERRAVSQPALVARSVRRRLGDPEPVRLGDVSYPVTTLLAAQLRDVVARAADREGEPADRVVLAHPTTWAPARRGRFEEVARAAGVEAPTLVTDAEAAVYHAAPGRLRAGGVLAVYDLGGGGFEATIVRTRPEGPEILGTPEGIDGFGGLDVDEAILSYVDDAVGGALARLDVDDARTAVALARLRHDCVLAKENLSLDTETVVPVFLPGRHFEIRLNRTTFDQMLRSQRRVDGRRPVARRAVGRADRRGRRRGAAHRRFVAHPAGHGDGDAGVRPPAAGGRAPGARGGARRGGPRCRAGAGGAERVERGSRRCADGGRRRALVRRERCRPRGGGRTGRRRGPVPRGRRSRRSDAGRRPAAVRCGGQRHPDRPASGRRRRHPARVLAAPVPPGPRSPRPRSPRPRSPRPRSPRPRSPRPRSPRPRSPSRPGASRQRRTPRRRRPTGSPGRCRRRHPRPRRPGGASTGASSS